jgi:pilus assembly protein FimV
MILTCQKCSTSFRLDETLLKATGSKVRCSLCQTIWVAFPPETSIEDSPESDDGGIGIGAAAFADTGAVAGATLAGGTEASADEGEDQLETPSELKFFADGDIDEDSSNDDELVTDEINLDELDHLLSEEDDRRHAPLPDEDFKTEELNLADLEKMLDLEADQATPEKENEQPEPEELELGDDLADDLDAAETEREDSVIEELNLDLEDLETLLEEDTGLGDEIAAVEESTGGLDEAIGGFDMDGSDVAEDDIELDMAPGLEELLEDDGKAPVVEETEEIAASEIADTVEEPERSAESDAGEDQDLDFELSPELDGLFDEGGDQDVAIEETEELDFSELGADLAQAAEEPEEAAQDEKATREGTAATDEDDLKLELDEDALSEGEHDDEALPELDLSELSQALEEGGPETGSAVDDAKEPELELEMDADAVEGGDAEDLALDMEDFDLGETAGSSEAGDGVEETRELDIDELESLLEGSGDAPDEEVESSSDSLELDIDLDGLDGGDDDDMEDATRELDLNDIEKILEMDAAGGEADTEPAEPAEPVEASQDLDLDLDMDDVPPPVPDVEETGEETTGTSNEFDLSELEKMLDVEDTTDAPGDEDEDLDDLDLDFDLQPATDESDDLDLEFDMLDEEPAEASALFDTSESEDLGLDLDSDVAGGTGDDEFESDLDFEIMDEDLAVEEVDLDIDAEEIGAATLSEPAAAGGLGGSADMRNRDLTQELMDEMAAADTQTMAAPPVEAKPIKPPPPMKKKKKTSKSLVLLFILILLGAAVYLLPKYTDIKLPAIKLPDLSGIPFIGDFMGAKSPEAIIPVETSLKGDWVQNQQAGRLYTIQGQVKNAYAGARSYIRVTGRVYANGRKFQQVAKAYCGNILTAEELATLSLADIQKKLSNRSGTNNINVKVAPGKTVPFLVVFGELPPEIELQEFAVEISGSLPVKASK